MGSEQREVVALYITIAEFSEFTSDFLLTFITYVVWLGLNRLRPHTNLSQPAWVACCGALEQTRHCSSDLI